MNINNSDFPRQLRKNSTDQEKILWRYLRNRQIRNLKFRRQEPVGKYIVDFVCFEIRMIIELDGGQHLNSENDQLRDRFFENQGFKVIRIWNNQTDQNLDDTLKYIYTECEILKNNHPHLTSPIQGEEE